MNSCEKTGVGAGRIAVVAMVLLCLPLSPSLGQWGQPGEHRIPAQLSMTRDSEAEAWLRKAREASQNQDWKLLADTLHRVVEQYGEKTVGVEDGSERTVTRFSTTRREAWRILAGSTPAALTAYRLTYDAEAAKLLKDARAGHDRTAWRDLMARYRPTTAGTAAADMAATWYVDEGRWFDALRALDDLETFPHEEIPQWTVDLRRAVAWAAIGQRDLASRAIENVRGAKADGLPEDMAERLRELERISATPSLLARAEAGSAWPWLLGTSDRAGRMATVEPNLFKDSQVRAALPDGAYIDRDAAIAACTGAHRAPVWEAVTDGRTLFVGTPTGFAALEPLTLTYRWLPFTSAEKARRQTSRPRVNPWMIQARQESATRVLLDPITGRAVFDELAGTLAAFDGLVFCIEQPQLPPNDGSEQVDGFEMSELVENSLAAYDAATGKLRWVKGRAGPMDDAMLDAHFFCAPVPVGAHIAALCQLGADLLLVVMKQDGTIVDRIPLGSGPENLFPAGRVLPMTVSDSDLIVQTGMGVVMCLDTERFALRWATGYPRTLTDLTQNFGRMRVVIGEGALLPDGWLRNPPIVRGDRVIVAPADSDALMALDRRDGHVRWRAPRGGLRYLVGADDRHVYATGDRIVAIGLDDGKESWALVGQSLSGRAVLSGARLLAPTQAGLLTVAAGTGDKLGLAPVDAGSGPLGNLWVWDNALYSLEFNAVRRFADLSREFAAARKRLDGHPEDDAARLKLARIHLTRTQWADALATLDEPVRRVSTDTAEGSLQPLQSDEADHLRVAALLGQARPRDETAAAAEADEKTESMLRRAAAIAVRPQDVVDAALAFGSFELATGRTVPAFERGLAALRRAGGTPLAADAGRNARGGVLLGEQLRDAWTQATSEERRVIEGRLNAALDQFFKADDDEVVRRLADGLGFLPAGARGDLWLARRELAERMKESAEFYLRRALARRGDAAVTAEAAARLARLSAGDASGAIKRYGPARECLAMLGALPPHTPLAADLFTAQSTGETTVGDFLRQFPALAPASTASRPSPDEDAVVTLRRIGVFAPQGLPEILGVWTDRNGGDDELLRHTAVALTNEGMIGIDLSPATAGQSRWAMDLANILPEDADGEPDRARRAASLRGLFGPAVSAGAVAAIPTVRGVQLVGLLTGSAMTRPVTPPEGREETLPDVPSATIDGMVFTAIDARTIVALPARSESTPVWRQSFETHRICMVAAVDRALAVIAADWSAAWVLDPATGRVRRRVALEEDAEASKPTGPNGVVPHRSVVAGSLAVLARRRELTAWRLTAGEVAWRRQLAKKIIDVRVLDAARIAVSDEDALTVLSTRDGRTLGRVTVKDATLPPVEATLDAAGQLVMALRTDENPPAVKLEWYNLASGERLVSQGPWPAATITRRMLCDSADVIPVVRYEATRMQEIQPGVRVLVMPPRGRNVRIQASPQSNSGRLVLYNKGTGARVGRPVEVGEAGPVVDVLVDGETVIVVTSSGWQVYTLRGDAP